MGMVAQDCCVAQYEEDRKHLRGVIINKSIFHLVTIYLLFSWYLSLTSTLIVE